MSGTTWRYRQCPSCKVVRPASQFSNFTYGANWRKEGEAERSCPDCDYGGETWEFPIVHQKTRIKPYQPSAFKMNPLLPPQHEVNPFLPPTTERPPLLDLFDAYLAETDDMEPAFEAFCEAMGWKKVTNEALVMLASNEERPTVAMSRFGNRPRWKPTWKQLAAISGSEDE